MKNKIIKKIKTLLLNFNSIDKGAQIHPTVKLVGSNINANVKIAEESNIFNSTLQGKKIEISLSTHIENSLIKGNFSSKENCKIFGCNLDGNIKLGKYSSLWGPNLDIITGNQTVSIGNFCSIARNVSIQTFNHNHKKITTYFIGQNFFKEKWENEKVSKGKIVIENDVWIGAHCVILGGITISNGAVIAANSVVNQDVPPYSIVAGIPAKVIGYRFDEQKIQELQKMQWWYWSNKELTKNKHLFEQEF